MSGTGWRRVLITTTSVGVLAALLTTASGALLGGATAAVSAAAAAGIVLVLSFLSLALIDWADRRAPQLAIPLFMIGFAVKITGLALAMPFVQPGGWLEPAWAIGAGVAVLLVWHVTEVLSFTKIRVTVDPEP